jgi:hypothetical protein
MPIDRDMHTLMRAGQTTLSQNSVFEGVSGVRKTRVLLCGLQVTWRPLPAGGRHAPGLLYDSLSTAPMLQPTASS